MKYDKMVALNKEKNEKKLRIALNQIQEMLEKGERVTVAALARYIGFAKTYFYRNEILREEVYKARLKQEIPCNTLETIKVYEMKELVAELRITITKLKMENERLVAENQKLMEAFQNMKECDENEIR